MGLAEREEARVHSLSAAKKCNSPRTEAEKGNEGWKEGGASRTELQSQTFGGEKALCQFCGRSKWYRFHS